MTDENYTLRAQKYLKNTIGVSNLNLVYRRIHSGFEVRLSVSPDR